MENLDSVIKSRDITLLTQVCSQSYGFPVVMYGYESWAIKKKKKAKHQRIVLKKTLESPLVCKIKPVNLKGNQH